MCNMLRIFKEKVKIISIGDYLEEHIYSQFPIGTYYRTVIIKNIELNEETALLILKEIVKYRIGISTLELADLFLKIINNENTRTN